MKEIKLTRGMFALVDDEDFEYLNQWKWNAQKIRNNWYAVRTVWSSGNKRHGELMHRVLLKAKTAKEIVDHKDRNGLNNQKVNLRLCTVAQNCANRSPKKHSTSKYLGVCWIAGRGKWRADIKDSGKNKFLGQFDSEDAAANAYNAAAKEIHGEFANLNAV